MRYVYIIKEDSMTLHIWVVTWDFIKIPRVVIICFPSASTLLWGLIFVKQRDTKIHWDTANLGKFSIPSLHPRAELYIIVVMSQTCHVGQNVCIHSCENGNFRERGCYSWNGTRWDSQMAFYTIFVSALANCLSGSHFNFMSFGKKPNSQWQVSSLCDAEVSL
jgi:hypothetical protein